MEALGQIIVLFILLLTGYAGKYFKILSNEMNKDISNIILYLALPALTIVSLSSFDFSKYMLIKSATIIIISFAVYVLSIILSYPVANLLGIKGNTRDVFQFSVVFSNIAYMGFPVINAIFGSEGIFYAALYNLPFNFLIWTIGVVFMSRPTQGDSESDISKSSSFNFKVLLNPGIFSILIGFVMFLTSFKLPSAMFQAFKILGDTTTPLSMMFVGSILADIEVKKVFTNRIVFFISITRLIILPLIVFVLLRPFGLNPILIGIPVIITSMPVAVNCAIFAAKYGNDYHMGSQAVFISTLLSMITIPLIVMLL